MEKELILILDFHGQFNQLIARRVRECNVYSEIVPYNISVEKIKEKNPKGIIFTGGPDNVYAENALTDEITINPTDIKGDLCQEIDTVDDLNRIKELIK